MDKTNFELFKQAVNEAVSNQFDKLAARCDEAIICSEKHNLAMRTIVYGKIKQTRKLSSKMKRLIAILVAAALLMTSCAIIFRNEIREVFEEFFVSLRYEPGDTSQDKIEEIYVLTYVPEGYVLENEYFSSHLVRYKFTNQEDVLLVEQHTIANSNYYIDSENGYSRINEIEEYAVYYRFTGMNHIYVWNIKNYSMEIKSNKQISVQELLLIVKNIAIK